MRRIRTSKPGVVWLQGPGPCDLWTYSDESEAVQAHELTFFGRTVVWREGRLLTGLCHEGVAASYTGSTGLLDFDRAVDPETLEGADRLLESIPEAVHTPATRSFRGAIRAALDGEASPAPRA